jgi:predicted site-specific integrase-resolvase
MDEKSRLVSSSVAAQALGVDRATLWRWAKDGLVTAALRTAGGHLRWDVDELRQQLRSRELLVTEPVTDRSDPGRPPSVG